MKRNRLMLLSLLLGFGVALTFTSCDDEDDNNVDDNNDGENVIVTDNITDDTTWEKENTYQLGGRIVVEEGATLTIEPGTIIKGEAGTGTNATALIVAKGSQIMAEGEADAPIIFTTVADEITPEQIATGDFQSPNLDPDANGYWGGVIVLGNAPISVSEGSTAQIEGIPATDKSGEYGGDDEDDNSGVLKYVSIRHGGSNIGEGNEINGLTLGGVGSGTTVENVEVVANQDDGIEWFGGTVDISNALTWNAGDDGLDADQGWNGTCSNFAVISSDDHVFELDGIEGDTGDPSEIEKYGSYTFKNGYVIANTEVTSSDLINLDPETSVHFENVFFTDIEDGQQITLKDDNKLPDDFLEGVDTKFTDVVLNVTDVADYIDGSASGVNAGEAPANESAIDLSVFEWTWAHQSGTLKKW
ncbi:MAG: hypothetical protein ACOCPW_04475 [Marinilabiliaceae bacterium]